jgi:hypothetical protein
MATRRELKEAIRERYQAAAGRRERRQILSEFVRVTGYHRKHALRVLNHPPTSRSPRRRERLYDEAVHQALTVLWEAADRICSKRLGVLIPVLLEAMERHGHLKLDPIGEKSAPGCQRRDHRSTAGPGPRSNRTCAPAALESGLGGSAERAGADLC